MWTLASTSKIKLLVAKLLWSVGRVLWPVSTLSWSFSEVFLSKVPKTLGLVGSFLW